MATSNSAQPNTEDPKIVKAEIKDALVETKHSVVIGEQTIEYTVTCGAIVFKEESEKTGDKAGEFEGEHVLRRLHPRQH